MRDKPHVVIIMADQLRTDVLGHSYTPTINRLAEESVVFNRAYCASPLCVPARGAFFTGLYPNENGCLINKPLGKDDFDYGHVQTGISNLYGLMDQDWDSWHAGKQHLFMQEPIEQSTETRTHWTATEKDYVEYLKKCGKKAPGGEAYRGLLPELVSGKFTRVKTNSIPTTGRYEEGFDYFFDGYFAKHAVEAIRNRDKDKPLLLNSMFLAPHPPFQIPEPWYSDVIEAELPDNVGKWYPDQSPLQLYNLTGALGSRYSREDWKGIWPVYLGLVSLLDYCMGMIVDELKNQGIYDDTLLIFTSDHGEMLGSHGLWQKMCMYEESVRTPLYIKFPKQYQPTIKQSDALVSAIDVLPTLCDYLELNPPERLSGISLMGLIEGEQSERDAVFIQYDGNGGRSNLQRCVLKGEFKLIVDMFMDEQFIELYRVVSDPQETVNLAFDEAYREIVEDCILALRRHMSSTKDTLTLPDRLYDNFLNNYTPFRKHRG